MFERRMYMNNIAEKITHPVKNLYNYLFSYDPDKLTTFGQSVYQILNRLSYAKLHKDYILVTFNNGKTLIGKMRSFPTYDRFVVQDIDQKLLHIINLNKVLRIDLN